MLDLEYVETEASELIEIYQQLEDELLRNIASRLQVNDKTGEIDIDNWRLERLQEMGQLNRENVKAISKLSGISEEKLKKAIEASGWASLEKDETIYQMAFGAGRLKYMPVSLYQSKTLRNLMRQAVDHAANEMNLVNTTALQSANAAFTDAVNKTYIKVLSGTQDYQSAIRQAVQELGEKGITGAEYISKKGRKTRNHIDVAVRRAVLTSSSQVAGKMQLERAFEWSTDLVEVSSHMGARPSHARWQGKIYSLSGKHPKYKDFYKATGYGTITGLKGVNCSHDFYPYFEGISERVYKPYDLRKNDERYEEFQQQRKIERDIRKEKRKMIAAEAAGDNQGVIAGNTRLREKQADMREFINETGLTRRRGREQVEGYVPGYIKRAKARQ